MVPWFVLRATGMLAALVACAVASVPPGSPAPVVTVTASNAGITGPDSVPAGYVMLRLRNQSDSLAAQGLMRLRPGVSPAEGVRAVRVQRGVEPGDRAAAAAQLDGFYGGAVFVAPGAERDVGVTLPAGDYVTLVDVVTARGPHLRDGFVRALHVHAAPAGDAPAPAPDHVARMTDMAFTMPSRVTAGPARWRFENAGPSMHLAFIGRLLPGRTYADGQAWLLDRSRPRPFEDDARIVGTNVLSAGRATDVVLDLAPGEYAVVCEIDGHYRAGMVHPLTVTR